MNINSIFKKYDDFYPPTRRPHQAHPECPNSPRRPNRLPHHRQPCHLRRSANKNIGLKNAEDKKKITTPHYLNFKIFKLKGVI